MSFDPDFDFSVNLAKLKSQNRENKSIFGQNNNKKLNFNLLSLCIMVQIHSS